jgi:hypothetical protein
LKLGADERASIRIMARGVDEDAAIAGLGSGRRITASKTRMRAVTLRPKPAAVPS